MALKLLDAIVGESEPVGLADLEALICFFEAPDFTIVEFERACRIQRKIEGFESVKVSLWRGKGFYSVLKEWETLRFLT